MWRRIARILGVVVATIALLEAVLVTVRRVPAAAIGPLTDIGRELYLLDRRMVQYLPQAARWDPGVGYTLRTGSFDFANTEFDTRFEVNRLGIRDDEASAVAPEIVVVGDSFAMGWGVDQSQSFAEVLQRRTGRRVLNTGMASWGTGRELRFLERVDLSAAAWLVIQFCNNDYFENARFVDEGWSVAPQGEADYQATVDLHRRQRRYWPGRYAWTLVSSRLRALSRAPSVAPTPDPDDSAVRRRQVDLFLEVVRTSPVDLSNLQIIVFELNAHNRDASWFGPLLRSELARRDDLPSHLRHMVVLDVWADLEPRHFYRLDDHLRPVGHELVAARVDEVIVAGGASDRGTTATGRDGTG